MPGKLVVVETPLGWATLVPAHLAFVQLASLSYFAATLNPFGGAQCSPCSFACTSFLYFLSVLPFCTSP
jgi:hypothetical protein